MKSSSPEVSQIFNPDWNQIFQDLIWISLFYIFLAFFEGGWGVLKTVPGPHPPALEAPSQVCAAAAANGHSAKSNLRKYGPNPSKNSISRMNPPQKKTYEIRYQRKRHPNYPNFKAAKTWKNEAVPSPKARRAPTERPGNQVVPSSYSRPFGETALCSGSAWRIIQQL